MAVIQTRHAARSRRDGFTLLEVMIALVVMGFGLLTLATMQIHALKQGSAGRHTGDASAVARTYLEQMQRIPWADLGAAAAAAGETDVFWANQGNQVLNGVDQPVGAPLAIEKTYNVTWTVTDVPGSACLRDVEVHVRWREINMNAPKMMELATRRYNWGAPGC